MIFKIKNGQEKEAAKEKFCQEKIKTNDQGLPKIAGFLWIPVVGIIYLLITSLLMLLGASSPGVFLSSIFTGLLSALAIYHIGQRTKLAKLLLLTAYSYVLILNLYYFMFFGPSYVYELLGAFFWLVYLLRSKRVACTFIVPKGKKHE